MEPNTEGNLLEIMDLARTLRQEHLFIQKEQSLYRDLSIALTQNSVSITKLAYICAQQKQNLNNLLASRPENSPAICCRRSTNYHNAKFIDAKRVLNYEHAIAYENLFNHLYRSPYLLALSFAIGDRLPEITPHHMNSVIQTISTSLYGNAISTKDVEMILKLLRELIEVQIVNCENPRRMLRANSSAFARLYHRLNESMFSAKIFLTAALFEPIMKVIADPDSILDIDPGKVVENFSSKERLRRFGTESSNAYQGNIDRFHEETITKLHTFARIFIDSLSFNWSLFPSTLRWLVQTMCHQLKQSHFSDKNINEIITDMVFTHFICPAIVSPDTMGIIDAPLSEQTRFNLMQIGQIIQMLALAKYEDIDAKFLAIHAKFKANVVTNLIDLLLVSQTGEDVVAILSQRSDFERTQLMSTQTDLAFFVEFFRILNATDEFDIANEEREKLKKLLAPLPDTSAALTAFMNGSDHEKTEAVAQESQFKERSKQSLINLGKVTKSKIAKSMSFNTNGNINQSNGEFNGESVLPSAVVNGLNGFLNGNSHLTAENQHISGNNSNNSSHHSSPIRSMPKETCEGIQVLVFSICNGEENKLQPLTEEEVLKMNSIGQEMVNGDVLLDADNNADSNIDKSSITNVYDGIDGMSDEVLRPMHTKTTRFSLSHEDASIANSDNLEAVSEAPSNHSVTSSLELEENDQNDNLSDMVSANVSGRGSPNISGRDTPSSQVTDGESVANAIPTPQMQKLLSKARSDIEDKFCKFELKKFEGDETVSIISDTWSTDVLASDSETVDANERERERDRNFSTPLIPSAVVLPGDNNFDALAGVVRGSRRTGYLDVSDQRSESNWSTDVLASDSEKFAEVDTDDNLSITAKSDITDAGIRTEQERDRLAAAISAPPVNERHPQRTPESPFYTARANRNFRVSNIPPAYVGVGHIPADGGDGDHGSGGSSGGNVSDRSQEDSAFYDAINMLDEAVGNVENEVDAAALSAGDDIPSASASLHHHYEGPSSLARSSVPTTNQFTGENSFQQNYKSSSNSDGKEPFQLSTSRMRRQTSAESSISNQSLNMEESGSGDVCKPSNKSHHKSGLKKKKHNVNAPKSSQDLIDFSDFAVEKVKPTTNSNTSNALIDIFGESEDAVEHRRISFEQRSTVFDGRRNGIMAMNGTTNSNNHSVPALRRHQSLNYENHEIMINSIIPKRVSAMPNLKNLSQTDDDKSQQQQKEMQQQQEEILLLCAKTEELHLNDTNESNGGAALNESNAVKPTKSTGAIPKSISFDATADKAGNNNGNSITGTTRLGMPARGPRVGTHHGHNSGIFNKIKQGIFKHRRNNKPIPATSHRHNSYAEEFSTASRSVSFSTNASEISLDMMGTNMRNGSNVGTGFCDINEDILAKYRRKVSTSSEATNSDSFGLNGHGHDVKDAVVTINRLSANIMHDKTLAFNIVKKKIRTVLSKTDLHTGDFRQNTFSNASPLLTYLQILLAQAINLQNFQQISYVSEAIRCISTLEPNQHGQLLEELQNDIQKRQNYLQYLMRFRQNLLLILENVGQFQDRLSGESATCNRYLMALCVRFYIEKRQEKFEAFQQDFARVTMSDDKVDLIEELIESIMEELIGAGGILHSMPDWQIHEARKAVERTVLQRMYQQMMFPNDDADVSRDQVLHEHIKKLQNIIRPSHPALCIPQEYLSEAPWAFAQQQLSYISAYITPREKLQCVIRCISSVMSLIHMSSGRVPAADDILPVLIYVVIKSNPPYLLSTVEYISCFIGEKLDGEEQFHWTLFDSVVKFIKTMDYLD